MLTNARTSLLVIIGAIVSGSIWTACQKDEPMGRQVPEPADHVGTGAPKTATFFVRSKQGTGGPCDNYSTTAGQVQGPDMEIWDGGPGAAAGGTLLGTISGGTGGGNCLGHIAFGFINNTHVSISQGCSGVTGLIMEKCHVYWIHPAAGPGSGTNVGEYAAFMFKNDFGYCSILDWQYAFMYFNTTAGKFVPTDYDGCGNPHPGPPPVQRIDSGRCKRGFTGNAPQAYPVALTTSWPGTCDSALPCP